MVCERLHVGILTLQRCDTHPPPLSVCQVETKEILAHRLEVEAAEEASAKVPRLWGQGLPGGRLGGNAARHPPGPSTRCMSFPRHPCLHLQEGPRGMDDVVTDDDADDDEEAYEAWRLRELRRIGMAREAREREEREAAEKERWRNMSEEERRRHLALNPREVAPKPKKKWGFLQVRLGDEWGRGSPASNTLMA